MTSKTDPKYENPIDNIFYKLSEPIMPILYKLNITPNHVTLLGNIPGILSSYYLYTNKFIYFVICLVISHFTDSLDGQYARKYNMVSKYGDFLDTASDFLKFFLLLIVVIVKFDFKKMFKYNTFLLILTIISLILTAYHNGCIEKVKRKYENTDKSDNKTYVISHTDTLSCPIENKENVRKFLSISRYFSNASGMIFAMILLYQSRKFRTT